MPEGDTILRAARTLARALEGRTVLTARSPLPAIAGARLSGRTIERVEARGKNLLFHFDDGRILHTHMRMTGSWHLYRPGETWRKPERLARIVLETDAFVAVCFNAPVVEVLTSRAAQRSPLGRLGADILAEEFDAAAGAAAMRALGAIPIGEALLHQGAIAGIGNIYKSESLFAAGVDPFLSVSAVSAAEIEKVLLEARRLMQANLGAPPPGSPPRPGSRRGARVYRRAGEPCVTCHEPIRMRRQGDAGRSTYWCPRCQKRTEPTVPGSGTFDPKF